MWRCALQTEILHAPAPISMELSIPLIPPIPMAAEGDAVAALPIDMVLIPFDIMAVAEAMGLACISMATGVNTASSDGLEKPDETVLCSREMTGQLNLRHRSYINLPPSI